VQTERRLSAHDAAAAVQCDPEHRQFTAVRPLFRPTEAELPEEAPETYPTGV